MDRHERLDRFLLETHRLAMSRLRDDAEALARLQARVQRARKLGGVRRHDRVWDRWQGLLASGDLDALQASVCAEDESGRELRAVSPIAVLFTQRERADMLEKAGQS